MMLSGVGTIGVYNYNTRTGVLSSKDDTDEEFIEFFNDELCEDETETMNGYDSRTKAGLKLQKKREERELKERREQKERMEEALEEYAQYRRELRHYYNELGYQKRLTESDPTAVPVGSVKRPPVVSAAYELILMLGM